MERQSGLGTPKEYRAPDFNQTKVGRVTSVKDFDKYGRIEVVFLDYGRPAPVWVVGDVERKPVEGDQVVIGYLEGRKDSPYLVGFVKNFNYTTNFMYVSKDKIRVQLPVQEIGVKDGKAHKDVQGHLLDDSKKGQRAYLELTPSGATISFPTTEGNPPAHVKLDASEAEVYHPTKIQMKGGTVYHHKGDREVARKGDSVYVEGTTSDGASFKASGTITTGSSKTKIE